jgi:hypothetical protein
MNKAIQDVIKFWEANPSWVGKSSLGLGTQEFFAEHHNVVVQDGFAGCLDERKFPKMKGGDSQFRLWDRILVRSGFLIHAIVRKRA